MKIVELRIDPEINALRDELRNTKQETGWSRTDTAGKIMWAKVEQIFLRNGYEKLGNGEFAAVFTHPSKSNEVIKVFSNDPNTVKWLKWCAGNQSNPYIPKIKSAPLRIAGDWFAVRMEYLEFKRTPTDQRALALNLKTYVIHYPDVEFYEFDDLPKNAVNDPNLHEIAKFLKTFGPNLDLNKGNVMMRGDQPVVTDPVATFG